MVTNVYRSVEVGGTKDMILGRCNLQRFQDSLLILPRETLLLLIKLLNFH